MSETHEINSLLVPLAGKPLLIPRSNVMQVAASDALEENAGNLPWLLGSMEWEGSLVPVVSFEGACGEDVPASAGRARVVLFRCLTDALSSRAFGIVSQGFPQLVKVSADALSLEQEESSSSRPILCTVAMAEGTSMIPDVEALEQLISDALAAST